MSVPFKLSPYLSAWVVSTIFAFSAANITFAVEPGDPVAGKEKSSLCQGCHGEIGMSDAADFPRLAGQHAAYIRKQFSEFKAQVRFNSDTMMGVAGDSLTVKQDLYDVAAYFASQKVMVGNKEDDEVFEVEDVSKGKNIFLNGNPATGLYGCVNCHGVNGKGRTPGNEVFPVIGGQHKDYLVKQLMEFRSAAHSKEDPVLLFIEEEMAIEMRKNDPAGIMRNIASRLSDEEIDAVTNYLAQL
jgi:cytochrome c553